MSTDNLFEAGRPTGVDYIETCIWEGATFAATAAYRRLASDDDKISLEALSALALEEAKQAAGPHAVKVVENPLVFRVLRTARALNAMDAARGMLAQQPVSPVEGEPN